MPLAAGTRLGPYTIASMLGAGGMGAVYKAHDGRLDREVAIKVLAQEARERVPFETVLEGSVRTAGTRLRVTAQLSSVADDYQIWSERYDRQMEDVFD